jgi:hypothetical protein
MVGIVQLQDLFLQLMREYWPEVLFSATCLALGTWWGRRRVIQRWQKKEFLTRVNVSLNSFSEGKLLIRTLLEQDISDVFHNKIAVETVLAKARLTTPSNPLIPLVKDDAWFYLNAVLNELSERFAEGFLRRDMGEPVTRGVYLICLTSEADGAARTRKIRAMVIRKDLLTNLPEEPGELERQVHKTRLETLRILAEKYHSEPHAFLEVELCV